MAIASLLFWMCTTAIGSYLWVTATRTSPASPPPPAPVRPVRDRDRFDPPSLQAAKSEPLPGLTDLAEFAHPALAIIGLGFWLGYVISRDRLFAAIGLGILLGAIGAGVSLFAVNTRHARRALAAATAANAAGGPGTDKPAAGPAFSARLLTLHAIGAALTLLFAALIAARA